MLPAQHLGASQVILGCPQRFMRTGCWSTVDNGRGPAGTSPSNTACPRPYTLREVVGNGAPVVATSEDQDEPPTHPSCFQAPVSLGSLVHRELLGYAQAQQAFFGLAAKGV